MNSFNDLGLDAGLLKALATEGYTTPTPIQAQAIPGVLSGGDLLGIAQTGTGKTAAFALPILHRLAASRRPVQRRSCRVLVLSPTRELASQIADSFRTYGRHLGFSVAVVFGGVGHRPQIDALNRGIDILVATPGRLLDHMGEGAINLAQTEILVLDEADQMLDLGFIVPIRRIVKQLPKQRQSLFFSATMPSEIGKLASELLTNPKRVAVAPVATTVERVNQSVIHVEKNRKVAMLAELFADPSMSRALVFTRTKRGADRVAKKLEMLGVAVAAIHGNKSQRQREAALAGFKASRIRALVATDIAARGIDVDNVSHVVNFELPNIPESYVHRIGRTARAGAEGIAISLCDSEERDFLRDIERLTRQKIAATDRRNDTSLVADTSRDSGGGRPGFGERNGRRPHGQQPRSEHARPRHASDRPRRGPHPGSALPERGEHGDRPRGEQQHRQSRPTGQPVRFGESARPPARKEGENRAHPHAAGNGNASRNGQDRAGGHGQGERRQHERGEQRGPRSDRPQGGRRNDRPHSRAGQPGRPAEGHRR